MKFEFFESKYGTNIRMVPDNLEEVSKLARSAKNTKKVAPDVRFSFDGDIPEMNVWIPKVKESVQSNSISN